MTQHAAGLFDVKMQPQPWTETATPDATPDATPGTTLGRLLLDKQYHGDLQAGAQGQMLSAVSGVKGSAGYVAIEVVTGTLHGKRGSFALMHRGVMDRGTPELRITVVPDSGTGELQGLKGQMGIEIAEGRHHYTFDYTLP